MALDITVYPHLSPRIVVIEEPQTEATVQNIVDTIRAWEDSEEGHTFPFIIDAAGKEDLGGGVTVGITATLNNAQIRFAARPRPLTFGVVTTANLDGILLIDSSADFIAESIPIGGTAFNSTTGAMETIVGVDTTSIAIFSLQAGSRQDWQVGDTYVIYPNDQCNIAGGNLVAVDSDGNSISSVLQSPNTQVVRSSSSSATLSDLEAIQYSSYGGEVTLDIINGQSGTAYPIGNQEFPVNNLPDAVYIANHRGFKIISILESMTIHTSTDIVNFTIRGRSHLLTTVNILPASVCEGLTIKECIVSGTFDGDTYIENCIFGNVDNFNGEVHSSGIHGNIKLFGSKEGVFVNCYTIDITDPPVIDVGSSGQDLIFTEYNGIVTIGNIDSTSVLVGIGLSAGQVVLENTITAGTIIVSGTGILSNNTTGSAIVNSDGLMNTTTVSKAVWDEPVGDHVIEGTMGHELYIDAYKEMVVIDVINGNTGTEYPTGTREYPVNNIIEALIIMNGHNWNQLHVIGSLTIPEAIDVSGLTIKSDRSLGNFVNIVNATTELTYFEDLTVTGTFNGKTRFTTCVLGELNNFNGGVKNSLLTDNIYFDSTNSNVCYFTECDTYVTSDVVIQLHQYSNSLNIIRGRGRFGIYNKTSTNVTAIDLVSGFVYVDISCNTGGVSVGGIGAVEDNSSPGCIVKQGSIDKVYIGDAVVSTDEIQSIDKKTKLIPGLF